MLTFAYLAMGLSLFAHRYYVEARQYLEHSLAFYDPLAHRPLFSTCRNDAKVMALEHLAVTLWVLGYAN
jgi:hypothetical protein